jgi:hydrogenase-4 component B
MSLVFFGFGQPEAGMLGLIASLYHAFNHAVFKSLLFLGAGSILHASGLRDLNAMGGLVRPMPAVAFYFLIGTLSISALPPLNGFVSEWLTFQTALQAPLIEHGVMRSLVPLFAATLALSAALTAMCFVKVYGVAFLGRPRTQQQAVHDASLAERLGLAWLSAGCVVLGLFPTALLLTLNRVGESLTGASLGAAALESSWFWLVPTEPARASYSPVIFLLVVLAVVLVTIRVVLLYHGRVRSADPWDCGFPEQGTRMQDTAEGFAQPIRQIFGPVYLLKRHLPGPDDSTPRYSVKVEDRHWYWLYLPLARLAGYLSAKVALLQRGRISTYLLYSFFTLIALLVFVR